jgi:three-Cys-motif partner protein
VLVPYFKEFAYHLGSARPVIYYVDGFAGPGFYGRPSGGSEPGSPVLIAQFADGLASTGSPFEVRCLNVEAVRKRYRELSVATAPFRCVEKNYAQPFTAALPDILERIGEAPAFFFIDPFGTKDIPFWALGPIFTRSTRTEVLITLHTDGIVKKAGYFEGLEDADPKVRRQAGAMTQNCADALGLSLDTLRAWWQGCIRDGHGGSLALEQRVLDHYRACLRGPATRFRFVKAFPVPYINEDAPPSERTPVCFYLVFATQHERGLEVMNAGMVRAVERFRHEEYQHTFWPMLLPQLERDQQIAQLEREIRERFAGREFTRERMTHDLMQETALLLPNGDYGRVLKRLVQEQKVAQLGPNRYAVRVRT